MDWRKPLFLDYLLSSKTTNKRLLSGCALALLASLLVFSLPAYLNAPASSPPLFFSRFFSAPPPTPAAALRTNLSTSSLAAGESDLGHAHLKEFPPADANNSTNPGNAPGSPHHAQETHPTATDENRSFSGGIAVPEKTRDVNVSRADARERTHFWNASGYDPTSRASPENDKQGKNVSRAGAGGKDDGHMQQVAGKNSSNPGIVDSVGKGANGSSSEGEARASKPQEANASRNEQDFEKTQVGSTSRDDGNSSMLAKNNQEKNASRSAGEGKAIESTPEMAGSKNGPISVQVMEELPKNCDIFNGRWVRDESMPYYPAGSCPYLDDDFNCHKNGRPDDDFLRWRWQPHGCNIPRLNATDFLERLRGKRLIFVGDSLNRNMWESLVCILRHSVKHKNKVYEASKRREFKTRGYYAFRFEDYGCSVDFVRSPFLVRELYVKNANGSYDEKLRLDLVDETTSAYKKADIVIFNTGHWWTHEKTSEGIDYYQEGNYVYPLLKVMEAYKKALKTWARWVDKNINSRRTQVFFRGYSLTHFSGGRWNSGGQCHKETEPIFNESYLSKYPSKMRVLEEVLHQKKTPVIYLNISRLTDYRKDGHPSIYRKKYASIEEQLAAEKYQDCSHWCLPGVPDTWNELLYASLLMAGKGSWKR